MFIEAKTALLRLRFAKCVPRWNSELIGRSEPQPANHPKFPIGRFSSRRCFAKYTKFLRGKRQHRVCRRRRNHAGQARQLKRLKQRARKELKVLEILCFS